MEEVLFRHPDFRPLQAPELSAVKAGSIKGPHQPPGEEILPKITEAAQGPVVRDNGKPKMLHHPYATSVI